MGKINRQQHRMIQTKQEPIRLKKVIQKNNERIRKDPLAGNMKSQIVDWWATSAEEINRKSHRLSVISFWNGCDLCHKFLFPSEIGATLFRCVVCGLKSHGCCMSEGSCVPRSQEKWTQGRRYMLGKFCPSSYPMVATPIIRIFSDKGSSLSAKLSHAFIFLATLFDPLLPKTSRDEVFQAAKMLQNGKTKYGKENLKTVVRDFPRPHLHTLAYFILMMKREDLVLTEEQMTLVVGKGEETTLIYSTLTGIDCSFWDQILKPTSDHSV